MTRRLLHRDILRGAAQIHLTRATLTSKRPKALHDHDFYELFWVQNGKVRHHLPDRIDVLTEGDIVFLKPGDAHALQGSGEHAMIASFCIHPDVITGIAARHPSVSGALFWSEQSPQQISRDPQDMASFNHAALQLETSPCDQFAAEAFLLPICVALMNDATPEGMPAWLVSACRAAKKPEVFREGAAGLVELTGKAHPHVARMVRKYLDQTPSDYINQIRMDYAARALVTDEEPIHQIAADCGIPNMSHFHKLFRAAHGLTPLQYRQQFQRGIVQP